MPPHVNIDDAKRLVSSVWTGELDAAPDPDSIEGAAGDPDDTRQREWNALDHMDAAKQWLRRE